MTERSALNIAETKSFFASHNIIPLKADLDKNTEVEPLLKELGNADLAIPYYAVYTPWSDDPFHFDGVYKTSESFLKKLEQEVDFNKANVRVSVQ